MTRKAQTERSVPLPSFKEEAPSKHYTPTSSPWSWTQSTRHLATLCCAILLLFLGGSSLAEATVYMLDSDDQLQAPRVGGDINSNTSEFHCPPGYMISPLRVNHGWHHLGYNPHYVNGLRFGCSGLDPDGRMESHFFWQSELGYPDDFGNANGNWNTLDCYPNLMTGVLGRDGQYIDSLGALCGDVDDILLGNYNSNWTDGPFGGNGGSSFQVQCPAEYVPTGALISMTHNGHYVDGLKLTCSRVEAVSSGGYNFGYGVGRTLSLMCEGTDLDSCGFLEEKYLPVLSHSLHNTITFATWRDFLAPSFHPDLKCTNPSTGADVDCSVGQDSDGNLIMDTHLLRDTITPSSLPWNADDHYALVTPDCTQGDCFAAGVSADTLYVRGPFKHRWSFTGGWDGAKLYFANDRCADFAVGEHWNLWDAAVCPVDNFAYFGRDFLQDVTPLVLLPVPGAGDLENLYAIFTCAQMSDLDAIMTAAQDASATVPEVPEFDCRISGDTIDAIGAQYETFLQGTVNVAEGTGYFVAETVATEGIARVAGWIFGTAAQAGGLSGDAANFARAVGSQSIHLGINGYFLVTAALELEDCNGNSQCQLNAYVQMILALASLGNSASEAVGVRDQLISYISGLDEPLLYDAEEIEPLLSGVADGYNDTNRANNYRPSSPLWEDFEEDPELPEGIEKEHPGLENAEDSCGLVVQTPWD